jgi:hypothetical protein
VEGKTTDVHYLKCLETQVWASQYGVTRKKTPLDNSSFLTTLLRRGMGEKIKASVKSHLMLSASMASGRSAALQDMKRIVCEDWRDANRSIWGGPHRDKIK